MCRRVGDLSHISVDRIWIGFVQARSAGAAGCLATITPCRFPNGSLTMQRDGAVWGVRRLFRGDREMLYVLSFFLPRFCNVSLEEKLVTIAHELWHIHPRFDGTLREFGGRNRLHGPTRESFDATAKRLAERYWRQRPARKHWDVLRHSFAELQNQHGAVVGCRSVRPKLVRIPPERAKPVEGRAA